MQPENLVDEAANVLEVSGKKHHRRNRTGYDSKIRNISELKELFEKHDFDDEANGPSTPQPTKAEKINALIARFEQNSTLPIRSADGAKVTFDLSAYKYDLSMLSEYGSTESEVGSEYSTDDYKAADEMLPEAALNGLDLVKVDLEKQETIDEDHHEHEFESVPKDARYYSSSDDDLDYEEDERDEDGDNGIPHLESPSTTKVTLRKKPLHYITPRPDEYSFSDSEDNDSNSARLSVPELERCTPSPEPPLEKRPELESEQTMGAEVSETITSKRPAGIGVKLPGTVKTFKTDHDKVPSPFDLDRVTTPDPSALPEQSPPTRMRKKHPLWLLKKGAPGHNRNDSIPSLGPSMVDLLSRTDFTRTVSYDSIDSLVPYDPEESDFFDQIRSHSRTNTLDWADLESEIRDFADKLNNGSFEDDGSHEETNDSSYQSWQDMFSLRERVQATKTTEKLTPATATEPEQTNKPANKTNEINQTQQVGQTHEEDQQISQAYQTKEVNLHPSDSNSKSRKTTPTKQSVLPNNSYEKGMKRIVPRPPTGPKPKRFVPRPPATAKPVPKTGEPKPRPRPPPPPAAGKPVPKTGEPKPRSRPPPPPATGKPVKKTGEPKPRSRPPPPPANAKPVKKTGEPKPRSRPPPPPPPKLSVPSTPEKPPDETPMDEPAFDEPPLPIGDIAIHGTYEPPPSLRGAVIPLDLNDSISSTTLSPGSSLSPSLLSPTGTASTASQHSVDDSSLVLQKWISRRSPKVISRSHTEGGQPPSKAVRTLTNLDPIALRRHIALNNLAVSDLPAPPKPPPVPESRCVSSRRRPKLERAPSNPFDITREKYATARITSNRDLLTPNEPAYTRRQSEIDQEEKTRRSRSGSPLSSPLSRLSKSLMRCHTSPTRKSSRSFSRSMSKSRSKSKSKSKKSRPVSLPLRSPKTDRTSSKLSPSNSRKYLNFRRNDSGSFPPFQGLEDQDREYATNEDDFGFGTSSLTSVKTAITVKSYSSSDDENEFNLRKSSSSLSAKVWLPLPADKKLFPKKSYPKSVEVRADLETTSRDSIQSLTRQDSQDKLEIPRTKPIAANSNVFVQQIKTMQQARQRQSAIDAASGATSVANTSRPVTSPATSPAISPAISPKTSPAIIPVISPAGLRVGGDARAPPTSPKSPKSPHSMSAFSDFSEDGTFSSGGLSFEAISGSGEYEYRSSDENADERVLSQHYDQIKEIRQKYGQKLTSNNKHILEGYARKKSPSGIARLRPWQKRYFKLFEDAVIWSSKKTSKQPLGILPLFTITSISLHPNDGSKDQFRRLNIVINDKRTVAIRFKAVEERALWANSIKRLLGQGDNRSELSVNLGQFWKRKAGLKIGKG